MNAACRRLKAECIKLHLRKRTSASAECGPEDLLRYNPNFSVGTALHAIFMPRSFHIECAEEVDFHEILSTDYFVAEAAQLSGQNHENCVF